MPATSADAASGQRAALIVKREDATIHSRYPNARDQLPEPAPGFFDANADASTILTARAALIGTERRRFAVVVADLIWPDPEGTGVESLTLVDSEQAANGIFMTARVQVDLASETTTIEVFG